MKTFTNSIKEQYIHPGEEKVIFERIGCGVITHMWFGGSYPYFETATVRIYVDQEQQPSIEAELFLMNGIGFADPDVFTTELIGKTGDPSGVYNTYQIPFGNAIKITVQMDPRATQKDWFWSIVRGTDDLPVTIAGVHLPKEARLKLQKLENHTAQPLEEFTIYQNKETQGALFMVAMQAKSTNFEYQESCIRGYFNSDEPELLSSGMEDYFLGTYYFMRGKYQNEVAGVTHLKIGEEFAGYRFHQRDPLFFGPHFRLTCRCGEKIGDKVFHNPQPTVYTVYAWGYEW